jgi:hypothetical protein
MVGYDGSEADDQRQGAPGHAPELQSLKTPYRADPELLTQPIAKQLYEDTKRDAGRLGVMVETLLEAKNHIGPNQQARFNLANELQGVDAQYIVLQAKVAALERLHPELAQGQ